MDAAGAAADAGHYKEALAIAQGLDAASGIPPQKAEIIRAMIVRFAMKAKDYATAADMVDRQIALKEGLREQNAQRCVMLSLLLNRVARAQDCAHQFAAEN
jgi:hypothetical protein